MMVRCPVSPAGAGAPSHLQGAVPRLTTRGRCPVSPPGGDALSHQQGRRRPRSSRHSRLIQPCHRRRASAAR